MSSFGAGFQAVGAYNQAKAQQASLQAESQVALNNAVLAEWQAQDASERGATSAARAMIKGGQVKGAQRAALAANGVDLSGASAQAVLNDTDYITAVDANTIADNAAREAWGYRMQSRQYVDKARMARAGAESVNPWLAAGTSLLSSATSVARSWYSPTSMGGGSGGMSWATGTRGMGD